MTKEALIKLRSCTAIIVDCIGNVEDDEDLDEIVVAIEAVVIGGCSCNCRRFFKILDDTGSIIEVVVVVVEDFLVVLDNTKSIIVLKNLLSILAYFTHLVVMKSKTSLLVDHSILLRIMMKNESKTIISSVNTVEEVVGYIIVVEVVMSASYTGLWYIYAIVHS